LHILLFILYSIGISYGIVRLPFFRKSGLPPGVLLALFAIHVGAGCLHNVIAWRFYTHHGDVWRYFDKSFALRHQMLTDFHTFITDWTWSYFVHDFPILINMLLNCLSFDNIYINTLLFAFPVFLGITALFRVFRRHFPGSVLPALSIYLLPSTLFWTACIHRDGLLLMSLGFFLYSFDRRSLKAAAVFLLLIAFFRFAVALTLILGLASWWWLSLPSRSLRKKTLLIGGLALLILLIVAGPLLLKTLTAQQQSFQILTGNSRIDLPLLDGTWDNFLHTLPAALLNGWLQPLPGAGGQKLYTAFSLELLLIWSIVALALIHRATTPRNLAPLMAASRRATSPPAPPDHFAICCIVFALSGMLIVGLIVPFVGAIVRYRSIYLPFLLAPALHQLHTTTFLRRLDQWIAYRL